MPEVLNLDGLRKGLTAKLWAMWVLLGALIAPVVMPSEMGLLCSILVPLSIDFVGRCLCANPAPRPWVIRLSIGAQLLGIICLLTCYMIIPNQVVGKLKIPIGVVAGTVLAVVLQVAAAKLFIAHLQAVTELIGRPDLQIKLDILRKSLFQTTFTSYGTGLISIVVIGAALFFGILAYGIGLILTLPLAFLLLLPLWMTCMVLYFMMLYNYQKTLQEIRSAIATC